MDDYDGAMGFVTGHKKRDLNVFPVGQMTDEECMTAYQNGQIEAFDELYRRHSGRVYGYLKNHLKGAEPTDEVFQITWMKVHRFRDRYRTDHAFTAWLFSIARNARIDWLRSHQKLIGLNDPMEVEALPAPPPRSGDTQEVDLLTSLSPEDRNTLELRYANDASFEEIGRALGITATSARQRVSRAIRRLRRMAATGEGS